MDNLRQAEYDFFIRAAALFEHRAIELAPMESSTTIGPMFRQAVEDHKNARLWAERILQGYRIVKDGEK